MHSLGSQALVEMYGCDPAVLDDVAAISKHMLEAAVAAGATVLHHKFHRFAPQGVSGMVIIAESHLAIHTWPEHRYAAVDLFTCGETLDQSRCFALLRANLRCERLSVVRVARGDVASIRSGVPELADLPPRPAGGATLQA